jgi:hypothetical protein
LLREKLHGLKNFILHLLYEKSKKTALIIDKKFEYSIFTHNNKLFFLTQKLQSMQTILNHKIALLACILLISQAVFAQKKDKGIAATEKYVPKFSYSPPERSAVASTGITIALLAPIFLDKEISQAGNPWSDLAKSMANDVEELLTAKGFKVRGPFNSVDEMVFTDKENSDFVVQIFIDMEITNDRKWKSKYNVLSESVSYKVEKGNVNANTKLILTAISCFTSEKLWKKNLDLPQHNFTYSGTVKWDGYPTSVVEMALDNSLFNPVSKYLEEIYPQYFEILFNQFDKDEMANLAKEARKSDGDKRK